MKVLIFENEYSFVQTAFEYVKDVYFDGAIEYKVYPNSQDLKPFAKIESFDCVFIDISLGHNSTLDGFGILKKIEEENLSVKKIVILTGNHLVKKMLKDRGVKKDYSILSKPLDFKDLKSVFDEIYTEKK